jgi:uncharacterized protein (UPF0332 family)
MSFDWAEYLTLARCLVNDEAPTTASAESRLRCAASRAYYAALCRAAAYLSNEIGEVPPGDHKFHEFVISHFRYAEERSWKRVGSRLEQLREHRSHADYDASERNWPKKAEASVELSEGAIQDLEGIFGPPVP